MARVLSAYTFRFRDDLLLLYTEPNVLHSGNYIPTLDPTYRLLCQLRGCMHLIIGKRQAFSTAGKT